MAADAIDPGAGDPLSVDGRARTNGMGGYLIWQGVPVFVDGRADFYSDRYAVVHVRD